eukprot:3907273-Rhodomonas_salina.2
MLMVLHVSASVPGFACHSTHTSSHLNMTWSSARAIAIGLAGAWSSISCQCRTSLETMRRRQPGRHPELPLGHRIPSRFERQPELERQVCAPNDSRIRRAKPCHSRQSIRSGHRWYAPRQRITPVGSEVKFAHGYGESKA